MWDNRSKFNIHVIGVPEGAEKENRAEKTFEEIITGKFPQSWSKTYLQSQKFDEPLAR